MITHSINCTLISLDFGLRQLTGQVVLGQNVWPVHVDQSKKYQISRYFYLILLRSAINFFNPRNEQN